MALNKTTEFLCGVATAVVLIPAAVLGYFALGLGQTRSDTKPPEWETLVMGSATRAAVRRNARTLAAPKTASEHAASEEAVIAGGKLYLAGCSGCHGEPGKPYREEHEHYPPVPQLPHSGSQYSEAEIAWIIKHGIRMTGMSAYGPFYKEEQVWALAAFVKRSNTLSNQEIEAIHEKTKR